MKNLENGEIFEENYDKLIFSPGAKPTQPRLSGVGIDKLFTLRTVEDTFRIKEYINNNHPKSAVLLDVRTVGEFSRGHIDGFKNIPVDELRERINEIEKGKPVYLICQSGLRSYIASRILEGNGYETYNFSGGFRFYDAVVNDRALIERSYACGMDY